MKIDMHCHVREGSIDSKVPIEEFIKKLQSKGIGGMLVTDHDTYNGYRHWKNTVKGRKYKDFVVLKGIEYDTLDAGHILIIMPQGVKMRLLELRGLPLSLLIDFVHHNGGICGPAHPCGEKYLSFTNTKRWQKSPELIEKFDFIETFNALHGSLHGRNVRRLGDHPYALVFRPAGRLRRCGVAGYSPHRGLECKLHGTGHGKKNR